MTCQQFAKLAGAGLAPPRVRHAAAKHAMQCNRCLEFALAWIRAQHAHYRHRDLVAWRRSRN